MRLSDRHTHPGRRGAARRPLAWLAAPSAALVLTAACADAPVAPALETGAPSLARSASAAHGPRAPKAKQPARGANVAQTRTFVYDPAKAIVQPFGDGSQVTIPAGAVCDPASAGYGVDVWDAPCARLQKPITFTVTSWEDVSGQTHAEFTPDVRFVPGAVVTLDLSARPGKMRTDVGSVFWCPTGSDDCFDEGAVDPTVSTTRNGAGNIYTRRLKHFSGYHIIFRSGDGGDGSMDGGY